jgi:hypothetical protein
MTVQNIQRFLTAIPTRPGIWVAITFTGAFVSSATIKGLSNAQQQQIFL